LPRYKKYYTTTAILKTNYCQRRDGVASMVSQSGLHKILLGMVGFVFLGFVFWFLGWPPFWKGSSTNFFPDAINLETNLNLDDKEFTNSVCKNNIQDYLKKNPNPLYLAENFLFRKSVEANFLSGMKVELSYKDGIRRKRFNILAEGEIDRYEVDAYIADISASEVNYNPIIKSKTYYGTLHKYQDEIRITLVNYSNSQKNVVSVIPLRQLDVECGSENIHLVEEIHNLKEISGSLNQETKYSDQTLQDKFLCSRNYQDYKASDINWPLEKTTKKIVIRPVFLTTRAGSLAAQKVDELPLKMGKKALRESLGTMIRVQSELYCSIDSAVRKNLSLEIAGINVSAMCDLTESKNLQAEIEKLQNVDIFKVPNMKVVSELLSYTNEEAHILAINNPDKVKSDRQKKVEINARKLIEAIKSDNAELRNTENTFEINIFIVEASNNPASYIPSGTAYASTIGATKDRNWFLVEVDGLKSVTLQHELGHLYALTHLSNGGVLYTEDSHPKPNFHDGSFALPQFVYSSNQKKIFHTVNINEVLDRSFLIEAHGDARLESTAFPSEQELVCLPDNTVILCTDPSTCNGARNSLSSLAHFASLIAEKRDFNIDIEDEVERGDPLLVSWEGKFPADGIFKVLSSVDETIISSRSVFQDTLAPLEISTDIPSGNYKVYADFEDNHLDEVEDFTVLDPIDDNNTIEINYVTFDESGEEACDGEWINQCNFIVANTNMECVAATEFNGLGCNKTNGCSKLSNFSGISDEPVSSLFVVGGSDHKLAENFDHEDNINLAKQRGKSLAIGIAEKLNMKNATVCPQIGSNLRKECGNLGFFPETERYAAAFVFKNKSSTKIYEERCIPLPPKCNENESLVDGVCIEQNIICPSSHELKNGNCTIAEQTLQCPSNYTLQGQYCTKNIVVCNDNEKLSNGVCIKETPICPDSHELKNGNCVAENEILQCPNGFLIKGKDCVKTPQVCTENEISKDGKCVQSSKTLDKVIDALLVIVTIVAILAI